MSLAKKWIPEYRVPDGPSMLRTGYQLEPGTSDYPSGGYPIKASDVDLVRLYGARVLAMNDAADAYLVQFDFASGAFADPPVPQTTIYMTVKIPVISGLGHFVEVSAVTDLSGCYWWVEFVGW